MQRFCIMYGGSPQHMQFWHRKQIIIIIIIIILGVST
jgi:hypothetical protein